MILSHISSMFSPSSHWVIEEALDRDVAAIAEIHGESFVRPWSDGDFEKMLADPIYDCLVARQHGRADLPAAGFVMFRVAADEAEIISIATEQTNRKKGAGRALMEGAIRQLEADRIPILFLEVDENNLAAISLYNSLHFKKIGERKGYYAGDEGKQESHSTALVMQRELG